MADTDPMGLISLNANGLGNEKRRRSLFGWLKKFHNANEKITFLQETHSTKKTEETWRTNWGKCDIYFSHGESDCRGVAIIIPHSIVHSIETVTRSQDGRYIAINLTINNKAFCLINCYAPNVGQSRNQLKWLDQVEALIELNSGINL
jgi:exonuclease III